MSEHPYSPVNANPPVRLSILLSAFACAPGRGSEPGVGWNWAEKLAHHHSVTVLTRAGNREAIQAAAPEQTGPEIRFEYYDLPGCLRRLTQGERRLHLYYVLWQCGVRWHYRSRLREFDLIHHVTYNSFRCAGFWWGTKRPVVLGPLGGGQVFPFRFLSLLGRQAIPEVFRSLAIFLESVNPFTCLQFGWATLILVANQPTAKRIPRFFRQKALPFCEIGITPTPVSAAGSDPADGPLRLLWMGRVVRTKGLELAVRALAEALRSEPHIKLTVLGDGPDVVRLKQLLAKLHIGAAVTWHGHVNHTQVPTIAGQHDAMVFTSLRDTTGSVVLEAMAAGLPLIAISHQGVREATTDDTALRVPPTTIRATIMGLAAAMIKLARDRTLCGRLGKAARLRACEMYDWEQRAKQMSQLYERVACPPPAS